MADRGSNALSKSKLTTYRSGIGVLLYLVKLTRPDMASLVQELSKFMDKARHDYLCAMYWALAYVSGTQGLKLHLKPSKTDIGKIVGYTDSNYASNLDSSRSVTGTVISLCGSIVSWRSKNQQCTTLSSMEAEYVVLSLTTNNMEFVRNVDKSMKFGVELPMVLRVDNTRAMELAKNQSTTGRTKHLDVRFHYVRELVEQGIIKLEYVHSEDNVSNIMTRNLGEHLFLKHQHGMDVQ